MGNSIVSVEFLVQSADAHAIMKAVQVCGYGGYIQFRPPRAGRYTISVIGLSKDNGFNIRGEDCYSCRPTYSSDNRQTVTFIVINR